MIPTSFPQVNMNFTAPPGLDESQVMTIPGFVGQIEGGNLDGSHVVIVAWQPDAADLARLNAGAPVFLQVLGGLAPHCLMTEFPHK